MNRIPAAIKRIPFESDADCSVVSTISIIIAIIIEGENKKKGESRTLFINIVPELLCMHAVCVDNTYIHHSTRASKRTVMSSHTHIHDA